MFPCFPTELTERLLQILTDLATMNKTFEACDFVLLQTNLSFECHMYGKFSGLLSKDHSVGRITTLDNWSTRTF